MQFLDGLNTQMVSTGRASNYSMVCNKCGIAPFIMEQTGDEHVIIPDPGAVDRVSRPLPKTILYGWWKTWVDDDKTIRPHPSRSGGFKLVQSQVHISVRSLVIASPLLRQMISPLYDGVAYVGPPLCD